MVTGPVVPVFPVSARGWIADSGIYSAKSFVSGDVMRTAATNNTSVFRRDLLDEMFKPSFGKTGGGDNEFF